MALKPSPVDWQKAYEIYANSQEGQAISEATSGDLFPLNQAIQCGAFSWLCCILEGLADDGAAAQGLAVWNLTHLFPSSKKFVEWLFVLCRCAIVAGPPGPPGQPDPDPPDPEEPDPDPEDPEDPFDPGPDPDPGPGPQPEPGPIPDPGSILDCAGDDPLVLATADDVLNWPMSRSPPMTWDVIANHVQNWSASCAGSGEPAIIAIAPISAALALNVSKTRDAATTYGSAPNVGNALSLIFMTCSVTVQFAPLDALVNLAPAGTPQRSQWFNLRNPVRDLADALRSIVNACCPSEAVTGCPQPPSSVWSKICAQGTAMTVLITAIDAILPVISHPPLAAMLTALKTALQAIIVACGLSSINPPPNAGVLMQAVCVPLQSMGGMAPPLQDSIAIQAIMTLVVDLLADVPEFETCCEFSP